MTNSEHDEQMARLEEHIAHQARTIEELSAEMEKQWSVVDRLERKQEKLIERLLALEERSAEETPVTRPPHY
ncbi:SlyX family protein [Hoeflea prorocentri]|uniref:SlyX family protein n=1 Tax=Hoeflea prorocentri TaxID=1922333 RepID=A0A9X3ULE0_9HYPH|nr:SlyX family protein [Hoeflea prorocentri]MCY6382990.1 SlyX family protein [Hoeflea prorocentri]MDA5400790.1 SlyX family protein [Hoeflea prorocentri]